MINDDTLPCERMINADRTENCPCPACTLVRDIPEEW